MDTGALFDAFVASNTFKSIQSTFIQLCIAADIDPCDTKNLYKRLRQISDWKAQKLWKLLDKRVEQVEYRKQYAADKLNVLIIGAGPCGLRAAIECALLGSRVVVVEQRDKFSRNNVLHLWEFVIHDLKSLGAKIFYPKFCTGSIEHISIRQLQCILLKVALCFGVQVHESVSFVRVIHPEVVGEGFRALLEPQGHILSDYNIDVLIGADGKRNTLPGFPREEMRGKLAIGITANFVNGRTAPEERVPEISGVAYIFNQAFFKEMYATTGVDLENIVYYKDETHYFVMTAKKSSLLEMGVIIKDNDDIATLLSVENVDTEALCRYARAAADFATNGKLPSLNFTKNHRESEDIAMFDFTSLYSAKYSVRLVEKKGKRLLMGIVGDSLHEPFWPTGSGCARGFLGVFDTAWLIREYALAQKGALEMIAERESVHRLLTQVTKDNMHKAMSKYTIDPRTRYVAPDMSMNPDDVTHIYTSDRPTPSTKPLPPNNDYSAHDVEKNSYLKSYNTWRFCQHVLAPFKLKLYDLDASWRDGRALSALISKFRSDALDYLTMLTITNEEQRLAKVFEAVETAFDILPPCQPTVWSGASCERKRRYIEKIVEAVRSNRDELKKKLITAKPHTMKRHVQPLQYQVRRKAEPIEKLAQDIFGVNDGARLSSPKIQRRETSPILSDAERHAKRLERLAAAGAGTEGTSMENGYIGPEHYTKRPTVDRLNPDLVQKVERIVSGEFSKEQSPEKERKLRRWTQKIDRTEIDEIERKLLDSAANNRKEYISSQDEKIIRASAADARREAESGFTHDGATSRFKNYDETIRRSEEAMKRRDLAGIDPFGRQKTSETTTSTVQSPVVEQREKSVVVMRPIVSVPPKRQVSMPVIEPSCYDSVNPRKQDNCQICDKVVYLAERIQVESMYLHRNCFRCAFCNQPLRLGEYGADKDLEYRYPKKYFCRTHLRVPLREKIAQIERAARLLQRAVSRESPDQQTFTVEEVSSRSPPKTSNFVEVLTSNVAPTSIVVPPLPASIPPQVVLADTAKPSRSTVLNFFSPEQIRERTTQRLQQKELLSPLAELAIPDENTKTPERAEFGNHVSHSRTGSFVGASSARENAPQRAVAVSLNDSTSTSDSEDEEVERSLEAVNDVMSTSSESASGSEVSPKAEVDEMESHSDEEELELEDDELEELDKTVAQMADDEPDKPISDDFVLTLIERINRRRSELMKSSYDSPTVLPPSPQFAAPVVPQIPPPSLSATLFKTPEKVVGSSPKIEDYYTPAVTFRDPRVGSTTPTRERARTIACLPMEDLFATPSADDIRKQKVDELERLRSESREKARMKTDEELGLGRPDRRSIPTIVNLPSTPLTTRKVMEETPLTKPRSSSLLNNMSTLTTEPLVVEKKPLEMSTSSSSDKENSTVENENPKLSRSIVQMNDNVPQSSASSGMGLLSKMFSPQALRKSSSPSKSTVNAERVHCESSKETKILGSTFRKLKMKRGDTPTKELTSSPSDHSTPSPSLSASNASCDSIPRDVPCAAVAPSPRVFKTDFTPQTPTSSISPISVTEKSIRFVHKRAERVRRQRDDERRRSAQDTQRGLEECEIRLDEMQVRGEQLEAKLTADPTNRWALESWVMLVQEREMLKLREETLRQRKRELDLEEKYRSLNARFKAKSDDMDEADDLLLKSMLEVVEERKLVKKQAEKMSLDVRRRGRSTMELLSEKKYSFANCSPVFTRVN